jgi:hypothetical protein
MSKRVLVRTLVIVLALLATAGMLWSMFGTSKLVFTESELQERLNQQLPRTVREVTIERVDVGLAESRLALRIAFQAMVLRQQVSAVLSTRGVPRYEPTSGTMHFEAEATSIDQLTIAGRNVPQAAGATLQRLAEPAIKAYLAARPVYRLKDDLKGVLLKAALVDVAIERDRLVVTFSIWNLTTTVAMFALLLIGALLAVYLLVRHPHWGLSVATNAADFMPGDGATAIIIGIIILIIVVLLLIGALLI